MRWLIIFLLAVAALWYIRGMEKTPPPKAEDSVIGEPVKALQVAQDFEKTYLGSVEEQQKKMEEQLEKDAGG